MIPVGPGRGRRRRGRRRGRRRRRDRPTAGCCRCRPSRSSSRRRQQRRSTARPATSSVRGSVGRSWTSGECWRTGASGCACGPHCCRPWATSRRPAPARRPRTRSPAAPWSASPGAVRGHGLRADPPERDVRRLHLAAVLPHPGLGVAGVGVVRARAGGGVDPAARSLGPPPVRPVGVGAGVAAGRQAVQLADLARLPGDEGVRDAGLRQRVEPGPRVAGRARRAYRAAGQPAVDDDPHAGGRRRDRRRRRSEQRDQRHRPGAPECDGSEQ